MFTQQREYPRIIRPSSRPSVCPRASTQPRDSNPPSNRCVAMASAPICRSSWRRGVVEKSRAKNINCAPSGATQTNLYAFHFARGLTDRQTESCSRYVCLSLRALRPTQFPIELQAIFAIVNLSMVAGPIVHSSAKMLHVTVSKALPTGNIFFCLEVLKVNCYNHGAS